MPVATAYAVVEDVSASYSGFVQYSYRPSYYTKSNVRMHYGKDAHGFTYHSFVRFNTSPVPDTLLLADAGLWYYQFAHDSTPFNKITIIRDPGPLGAESLFHAIVNGEAVVPSLISQDGWVVRPFGERGVTALDSARRTGHASYGISATFYGMASAHGAGDPNPPYLRCVYFGPSETDMRALRAELATYPLVAQGHDTALVTITNAGRRVSDACWVFSSTSGAPAGESLLVGPVAPGETISVLVPLAATATADTMVDCRLWTDEAHDGWRNNDSTVLRCWAFPTATYSAQGFDNAAFPPLGWAVVNNDSGPRFWRRGVTPGICHSGDGFAWCYQEQTRSSDDWLISRQAIPVSDNDSVGFFARCYWTGAPLELEVWLMDGQAVGDTVARLGSYQLVDTLYCRYTLSIRASAGDTIHVGFRIVSQGSLLAACLDDVWFEGDYLPGTDEHSAGAPMQPALTIEPNPATGSYASIRYTLGSRQTGRLALRDVLGRAVRTVELDATGTTRLDLRGTAPGVYVATLEPSSPLISGKLIITAPR